MKAGSKKKGINERGRKKGGSKEGSKETMNQGSRRKQ